MPLKKGNKTYKTFGSLVGSLKREGKSDLEAKRIAGYLQKKQEPNRKRNKNKKK